MRILLSFYNGLYDVSKPEIMPPFYESFVNGLRHAGNDVVVFMSRQWQAERFSAEEVEGLRKKLEVWSPDLVIAFNNYGPEIIFSIDAVFVVYEVDSPVYYSHKDLVKENASRFKFIVVQESARRVLRRDFGVSEDRILVAPFFTELTAEDLPKKHNIAFVGTRFWHEPSEWQQFLCERNRTKEERDWFCGLLDAIKADPFARMEDLSKRFPGLSIDRQLVDGLLAELSSERRELLLSELADLGLCLRGVPDWRTVHYSRLALSYDNERVVTLKENQYFYNSSRLAVNINHLQAREAFSWRVLDIMATSCCIVTEDCPGLDLRFPGLRIPRFRNRWEAREVCKRLLESSSGRAEISAACREVIELKYRFRNVLSILESASGMTLAGDGHGTLTYVSPQSVRASRHRHPVLSFFTDRFRRI